MSSARDRALYHLQRAIDEARDAESADPVSERLVLHLCFVRTEIENEGEALQR